MTEIKSTTAMAEALRRAQAKAEPPPAPPAGDDSDDDDLVREIAHAMRETDLDHGEKEVSPQRYLAAARRHLAAMRVVAGWRR